MNTSQPDRSQDGIFDDTPLGSFQIRIISLAFLCALVDGLDFQVVAYAAPQIARTLQLSDASLGIIFSVGLLGSAFGAMTVAPLGDRYGRKMIIVICLLMSGICTALTPFVSTGAELYVLRVITGIWIGGVMPNAVAIAIEYSPTRYRSLMVTLTYIGFAIGAGLGGAFAAALIPRFGWETVFFLAGSIPLLVAILSSIALPESLQYLGQNDNNAKKIRKLLAKLGVKEGLGPESVESRPIKGSRLRVVFSRDSWKNTLLIWIAMFGSLASTQAILQWLPTILQRKGRTIEMANSLGGLVWLAAIIGVFILVYAGRKFSLQWLLVIYVIAGGLIMTIFGLVMAIPDALTVPFLVAFSTGIGMTCAASLIGFYSLMGQIYPVAIRATGIGWAQGVGRLGAVAGPAFVGLLIGQEVSYTTIFLWLALPLFVSAAAVWNMNISPLASP